MGVPFPSANRCLPKRESCEAVETEGQWNKKNGKARLWFLTQCADLMIPMHRLSSIQFSLHGISRLPPFKRWLRDMMYSRQWNLRSGVTEHREAPGVSTSVLFPAVKAFCSKGTVGCDGEMEVSHPLFPAEGISDQPLVMNSQAL